MKTKAETQERIEELKKDLRAVKGKDKVCVEKQIEALERYKQLCIK